MLHPKYELKYFADAGWENEWIDTAKQVLHNEWETQYKHTIDPSFLDNPSPHSGDDNVRHFKALF